MLNEIIEIYTDGSYIKRNNKIYCGYGIYFPNGEYKSISRKFTHEPITNNRAELYSILKSIIISNIINNKRENKIKEIKIYSDSEYSIKSLTIWYKNWIKSNKNYLNKDIIDEIIDHINNAPFKVNLIHVRSHTGNNDKHSINNDIVDKLAKKGAFTNKQDKQYKN
jgi:ribonuclease HI